MGWATSYIEELKQGKEVEFRPKGNSMVPKINSGDLCRVGPVNPADLVKGDIVLCKVNGNQYLHLVSGIKTNQIQISNNQGHVNGWTPFSKIYGILLSVTP